MYNGGQIEAPLSSQVENGSPHSERSEQSTWLFLSLYLMLFAFFVVLNSYSSIDATQRDAVISSVTEAFARISGTEDGRLVRGAIGSEGQAQQFQDDVTAIFVTTVPLQRLRIIQSGTRIDVDAPMPAFFEDDSVNVRQTVPMLDRIIATISSPPNAIRYELVILGQVGESSSTDMSADMTTELARAARSTIQPQCA